MSQTSVIAQHSSCSCATDIAVAGRISALALAPEDSLPEDIARSFKAFNVSASELLKMASELAYFTSQSEQDDPVILSSTGSSQVQCCT